MKKIFAIFVISIALAPVISSQVNAMENSLTGDTSYGLVDNRNTPINTPLGTVEDQYLKPTISTGAMTSSPIVAPTSGTGVVFSPVYTDNKSGIEAWKTVHCAIFSQGFTWMSPIDIFVNKLTCGNNEKGADVLRVNGPQLEKQRQIVRDYIASMKNTTQSGMINPISTESELSKKAALYKEFATELAWIEADFSLLNESNIDAFIEEVARVFDKTQSPDFIPEYRYEHLITILQQYYAIPNSSREKLEELAIKYNFVDLKNWMLKTKNMTEDDIAFEYFGLINGEHKISEGEKTKNDIPVWLYNFKGKLLNNSLFDITATPVFADSRIQIKNRKLDSNSFVLIGENIPADTKGDIIVSISPKNNPTHIITKTLPVKFVKAVEIEEKIITPSNKYVSLPNGWYMMIDEGLITADTKVKIIARIEGDVIVYRVVYANSLKVLIAEKEASMTMYLSYPGLRMHSSGVNRYQALKYFVN